MESRKAYSSYSTSVASPLSLVRDRESSATRSRCDRIADKLPIIPISRFEKTSTDDSRRQQRGHKTVQRLDRIIRACLCYAREKRCLSLSTLILVIFISCKHSRSRGRSPRKVLSRLMPLSRYSLWRRSRCISLERL